LLTTPLDEVVLEQDLVLATRDHRIRTGVIPQGAVCSIDP
jgi:hypothetical protein